ncbi:hypothetical protein L1887_54140 [Cichorium endivia]|nr:hypothetical protein L1887_54140 [Cichorium endivia]
MMGVLVDGRVGALGVGIGMRVEIGLLDLGTCPWGAKLFVDHLDGGVKGCGRRLILAGAFEGRWWRRRRLEGSGERQLHACGRVQDILGRAGLELWREGATGQNGLVSCRSKGVLRAKLAVQILTGLD